MLAKVEIAVFTNAVIGQKLNKSIYLIRLSSARK